MQPLLLLSNCFIFTKRDWLLEKNPHLPCGDPHPRPLGGLNETKLLRMRGGRRLVSTRERIENLNTSRQNDSGFQS